MMSNDFQCWIDYEYKSFYNDSSKQGIHLVFSKDVNHEYKRIIKNYLRFLRRRFFSQSDAMSIL